MTYNNKFRSAESIGSIVVIVPAVLLLFIFLFLCSCPRPACAAAGEDDRQDYGSARQVYGSSRHDCGSAASQKLAEPLLAQADSSGASAGTSYGGDSSSEASAENASASDGSGQMPPSAPDRFKAPLPLRLPPPLRPGQHYRAGSNPADSSLRLPEPSGEPEGEMPPSAPPIVRSNAGSFPGTSSKQAKFNLQAEQYESRISRNARPTMPLDPSYGQQPSLNASAGIRNDRIAAGATANDSGSRSLTQVELKRLAEHEVVLLIDQSGSMSSRDCPSGNSSRVLGILPGIFNLPFMPMSRWNWCLQQTSEMARQTQGIYDHGITVVLFSSGYRVFPNVTMDNLPEIFRANSPMGGTNLADPLALQIGGYFKRRAAQNGNVKPLIIGVITDGCPSNPRRVVEAVVEATQLMHNPQELTIIFFLIGGMDMAGERFVGQLSNNLLNMGARFPIVKEVSFAELENTGLAKSIAQNLR